MKSNIKRLSLCLSALMLLILASPLTVLAAEEEVAASAKFYGTFWSLVPPLVAIAPVPQMHHSVKMQLQNQFR